MPSTTQLNLHLLHHLQQECSPLHVLSLVSPITNNVEQGSRHTLNALLARSPILQMIPITSLPSHRSMVMRMRDSRNGNPNDVIVTEQQKMPARPRYSSFR